MWPRWVRFIWSPNANDCNADPSLSGCTGGGSTFVPPSPDIPSLISGNGPGDSTSGLGNSTTNPTQQKKASKPSQNSGGCGYTSILGLCVKDTGKFAQGSAEVLGSVALLIGAFIGLFQSGGLLWALAQAFQMLASGILSVIRNGISNILNSLDGAPNKGFRIFLDALQFVADLATTAFTIISFWQNMKQIGKYPGNTFSKSWSGFWKTTRTLVNKGTLNATTRLAATTVGNFVNTFIGGDLLINDGEQLISDIVSN